MNSVSLNLHNYCSNFIKCKNDVSHFQAKLCKFYTFFYFKPIDVSALTLGSRSGNHAKLFYLYLKG